MVVTRTQRVWYSKRWLDKKERGKERRTKTEGFYYENRGKENRGRENRRETEGWRSKERVRARQKFTESYRFSFTPAWTEIARVQLGSRILSICSGTLDPIRRGTHFSPETNDSSFRRFPSGDGEEAFEREKGIVWLFISRDWRRLKRKGPGQGPAWVEILSNRSALEDTRPPRAILTKTIFTSSRLKKKFGAGISCIAVIHRRTPPFNAQQLNMNHNSLMFCARRLFAPP